MISVPLRCCFCHHDPSKSAVHSSGRKVEPDLDAWVGDYCAVCGSDPEWPGRYTVDFARVEVLDTRVVSITRGGHCAGCGQPADTLDGYYRVTVFTETHGSTDVYLSPACYEQMLTQHNLKPNIFNALVPQTSLTRSNTMPFNYRTYKDTLASTATRLGFAEAWFNLKECVKAQVAAHEADGMDRVAAKNEMWQQVATRVETGYCDNAPIREAAGTLLAALSDAPTPKRPYDDFCDTSREASVRASESVESE